MAKIPYDHMLLIAAAAIMAFKFEGQYMDTAGLYNRCLHDRNTESHKIPHQFLSMIIWNSSKLLIGAIVFAISFWQPVSPQLGKKTNWRAVFLGTYNILWYACWYPILFVLKNSYDDRQCSRNDADHFNSVSGHSAFHTFQLLSILYIFVSLKRSPLDTHWYFNTKLFNRIKEGRVRLITKILLVLYGMLVLFSAWTMYRTWRWGYHSLRQILNGVLFGLFIHYVEVHFLLNAITTAPNHNNRPPRLTRMHLILALALMTTVSVAMSMYYTGAIPYHATDIAVFVAAWGMLLYSYAKDSEHLFFVEQGRWNRGTTYTDTH
eukprot:TRINITY_DN6069_c0_g1_i1.p1 TRINITY_DN6069_c0_g1~~TRINITY_DN6069_c0_g1_i1.p1  ORF type:complete len:320 (-),score=70.42 TRINITY_DN6069_c0_g1_i1:78-1037(-)